MSNSSDILDNLRVEREGTSRSQRMQDALSPSHVQVIGHDVADWIVLAQRMATDLKFFNFENQVDGDWAPFFSKDSTMLLALAAVQKVDFYKLNIQGYLKVLLDNDNANDFPKLDQNFRMIFDSVGTLATQLDQMLLALPPEIQLKTVLKNLIGSQLAEPFSQLRQCYNKASGLGLLQTKLESQMRSWSILGVDIMGFDTVINRSFSDSWKSTSTFDASIIFGSGISAFDKINFAAGHNLFTNILDQFLKVYARIVAEAKLNLEHSLTGQNDHQPHFALFLTFLRLLLFAKEHVNELSGKHLNFYFKDILRLKKREAAPNYAHLIFELPKHIKSHLVKKGRALKAGKDSNGKPVVYKLLQDFVANRASVSSLRSMYFPDRLFAFPIANSKDGFGKALDTPDLQWDAFAGDTNSAKPAQVGFAISSNILFLKEGYRIIKLKLDLSSIPANGIIEEDYRKAFDYYLTGPKDWVSATLLDLGEKDKDKPALEITLILDGGQPAIVPLDAKLHGTGLPEGLPTLKMVLKTDVREGIHQKQIQDIRLNIEGSSVSVFVGYDDENSAKPNGQGLKDLQVITKLGLIKPDKPFQPFGATPEAGDSLIIGSDEVFQKNNARLQFFVEWKGLPEWRGHLDYDWVNQFTPRVLLQTLRKGSWVLPKNNNSSQLELEQDETLTQIFNEGFHPNDKAIFPAKPLALTQDAISEPHFDQQPFSVQSRNGFIRLTLKGDFGHKLYQLTLARYLMRVAREKHTLVDTSTLEKYFTGMAGIRDQVYKEVATDNSDKKYYEPKNPITFTQDYVEHFSKVMPNMPYTPEMASLSLSYRASANLNEVNLYSITPFGYKSIDPLSETGLTVIPAYSTLGELYIGIENLVPPQNLSLLFQLAEGSADPTLSKPFSHVAWRYLSNNEWKPVPPEPSIVMSDGTGQLTRSGIVSISMPKDATNDGTVMLPKGLHWICMSVSEQTKSICKVISIKAQATLVEFADNENAADYLSSQQPFGTISKFVEPDSAVKKIEQPYATFGGREIEEERQFYTRVSERLRHKQRSITCWDYERMVLEAFPQIFKVKCLNHTRFEPSKIEGERIYNELAPGHVTVVAIPNLQNQNGVNPMKPYTSLGDLENIKQFLKKHVSCFVQLHVHNPVYESVKVKFSVKLSAGVDEGFHVTLLKNLIVRHLAPWAFGDSQEIRFGGKVYKSALIDLVEEQDYVDYVTKFQLFHEASQIDLEEVSASNALAVLVPDIASNQEITPILLSTSSEGNQKCDC